MRAGVPVDSQMSADDWSAIHTCLARLMPYVDRARVALTGGVAIELRLSRKPDRKQSVPRDLDFVARTRDAVDPRVAGDFLVKHYHTPQRGYPKFLIQLVDPVSRLRIDIFPDLVGSIERAGWHHVAGTHLRVLDAASILDHKLATLSKASRQTLVEEKHYSDALALAAFCRRRLPVIPTAYLVTSEYGSDVDARCARCEASRDPRFPLAPNQQILDVLGYV